VVAAAPATGLSTLMGIVATPAGAAFLPFSIPAAYSWSQTYRDLPITSMFTTAGAQFASTYVTRGCSDQVARAISAHQLRPAGVFLTSAATDPNVLAHAKANDPGNVRTLAPMLVVQGSADETVPPALTDAFVTTRACPVGDVVEYLKVTGATHGTVVFSSAPAIVAWMNTRVGGKLAPTTCGQPGDAATLTP
jgi:hypothetical protein